MGSLVLKLALKYLESHPDVVEQLVEQAFKALLKAVTDHNAKA